MLNNLFCERKLARNTIFSNNIILYEPILDQCSSFLRPESLRKLWVLFSEIFSGSVDQLVLSDTNKEVFFECIEAALCSLPPTIANYEILGGGIWKIKKGGGSMVQGQVFLKGGGWHFSYLIFSRFIIFTFRNYFIVCKIALCIWRKIIFFCHHNFMKKGHSKLSKKETENIP